MQHLQYTIKTPISASGIGLHSGKEVKIDLYPAEKNTGIIFRRIDISPPVEIYVTPDKVGETALCTTLVEKDIKISTIEHLMSAIFGMGIDNLRIDINSSEVPILDGSASIFIFLLQSAGIKVLDEPKKFVRILKEIEVKRDNGSWAKLSPYEGFKLTFKIEFDYLKKNEDREFSVDFTSTSYLKEMSRARTFGFLKDAEYLKQKNLALGGSVNNAVIIDDDKGVINDGGLRYQNELVKHKVLDAVGDLFVLKYPIIGLFQGYKSGHALNNLLLRKLLNEADAWETVSFNMQSQLPINYINSKVS